MFEYYVIFVLFAVCSVHCNVTSICSQREIPGSYLDVAIDMIWKAKYFIPTCDNCHGGKAKDCADLLQMGHNVSGVYKIWPMNRLTEGKPLDVYCDMHTSGGGWTVIQRRGNFQRPKDYFFKDWQSYKEGFGDIDKDFWLALSHDKVSHCTFIEEIKYTLRKGNDNIFALTNQKLYSARFDLKDVDQHKKYALYDKFWIDDESNQYTLHLSDYSGNAGDSMTKDHNNKKFSTKDRENDVQKEQNCAELYKGGWWYGACHQANLNGLYLRGKHESFADGVEWHSWHGYHESLECSEIKVRPRSFRLTLASGTIPKK